MNALTTRFTYTVFRSESLEAVAPAGPPAPPAPSPWFDIVSDESGGILVFIRDNMGRREGETGALVSRIANAPRVEVRIDSTGGCVLTATKIVLALMDRSDAVIHVDKHCGSAAVALLAGSASVSSDPWATFLIHPPRTDFAPSAANVTVGDLMRGLDNAFSVMEKALRRASWRLRDGQEHCLSPLQMREDGLIATIAHRPLPDSFCEHGWATVREAEGVRLSVHQMRPEYSVGFEFKGYQTGNFRQAEARFNKLVAERRARSDPESSPASSPALSVAACE